MKRIFTTFSLIAILLMLSGTAYSQSEKATKKFKTYVNKMVENVEDAKSPSKKRSILNHSFNKFLTVFDRVENIDMVSETDKEAIVDLQQNIQQKKQELNGEAGFDRVPDNQLNNFANYVQQDLEQADTVITISATTLLLIIIILLLL